MGVVYRAIDTRLARPAALKFPLPGQRIDGQVRERFLREARAAAALDHPNICAIYEAGETDDGQLFLAMPLYPGETLKARLSRAGPLPIADAVSIAEQIARGLIAAHRAGIVHRDLKPANVMLLPGGEIKILDFGVARMGDAALTKSRDTLGTVAYMAPEQVRGERLDGRADLWALGVLLYEMSTGRRPFEGEHEIAVAHAIVHSNPARPSALRPDIDPELEASDARAPGARPGPTTRISRSRGCGAGRDTVAASAHQPSLAARVHRISPARTGMGRDLRAGRGDGGSHGEAATDGRCDCVGRTADRGGAAVRERGWSRRHRVSGGIARG